MEVALQLFAEEGFNAVSTSRIAKAAEVSEGLLFKHFKNKKGLLDALVKEAEVRSNEIFGTIFTEEDPQKIINLVITSPFEVKESEYDFWRLQFMLKWNKDYYKPDKLKPVEDRLKWAFKKLNYKSPLLEAQLLLHSIEAISIATLRDGKKSQIKQKGFLLKKYNRSL